MLLSPATAASLPMAILPSKVSVHESPGMEKAFALVPIDIAFFPSAVAPKPMAIDPIPSEEAEVPMATALSPLALA